jgi:hypothetical protein
VVGINMLDIEESGGTIDLFDADGGLINSVAIPVAGDSSQQEVIINADNVSSMELNLAGSGAVDDLTLIPPSDDETNGDHKDGPYIEGIPVLKPVTNDKLAKSIDGADAEDEGDILLSF